MATDMLLAQIGPSGFRKKSMLGGSLPPMGPDRFFLGPKMGRYQNDFGPNWPREVSYEIYVGVDKHAFGPNWAKKILYKIYVGMVLIPNGL